MSERPQIRFLDRTTPPHLFTLVCLAGVSAATMTLFLPSLPGMAAHFDTEYRLVQLTVTLYLAMNALLQLMIGPLSDRLGRRPVLLASFGLFVLFSIAILFATSVEMLLILRLGQGVVVSGIVLSRAVVRDVVPQNQAASMIGYVTMGMSLVPMFAPLIGGNLDQVFGWQANFILLAVLGMLTLLLIWFDLGETAKPSAETLGEQFRQAPALFASPRFWGYNLATTFASGSFFAFLGGAPLAGAEEYGLSPALLGAAMGAPAVGYLLGNAVSGRLSARIGINPLIVVGTLLGLVGPLSALALTLAGAGSAWVFFGFMSFVGLGNGLVLPNAMAGMLSVRPKLAGTASGIGGAMMIGGGAALSALASGLGSVALLMMMLASAALAVLSILYVLYREQQIAVKRPS